MLLFSQTTIPEGDVSGNWSLNGSPYLVEGEITIPDGETLSIEPGVYIQFQGHYTLNVQGQLLAIGTAQDSIRFTVIDTTGFHLAGEPDGSWNGIHFYETPATNDSTKIVYCILEYSKTPIEEYTGWNGGAIYIYDYSKVLVSHCLIINNRAQSGGGICIIGYSDPVIDSNIICFNISSGLHSHGGGICIRDCSSPIIKNNIIHDNIINSPNGYGGGMYIGAGSNPTLSDNIIRNNLTANFGGGIDISNSSEPVLISNRIEYNNGYCGGGINIRQNAYPVLINNIISNNLSEYGGAIYYEQSSLLIINNTLVNNTADHHGGGICSYYVPQWGDLKILNSILYHNQPEEMYILGSDSNITSIAYSIIENGEAGIFLNGAVVNWLEGNLDIDPMFADTLNYDYHLQDCSLAIGAGVDSLEIDGVWYFSPEMDFEGNYRPCPIGSMPDIGAYESPLEEPVSIDNSIVHNTNLHLENYPNPFNPSTTITFSVTQYSLFVTLEIYNIKGQRVKQLVSTQLSAGQHSVIWHGEDESGKQVSSGIYFYKLNVDGKTEAVKKCLLLK